MLELLAGLMRDAALECVAEAEQESEQEAGAGGRAWAHGRELYQAYLRLLSVRHASSTLRHLLMHGVAVAVRLEQSVLWPSQQRCALLQPQHELAEPLSRRLLRECGAFSQLASMLHAQPRGGTCLALCLQALRTLPLLTWGSPHAVAAFAAAVGFDQLLLLLLHACDDAPPPVMVALLFNWLAAAPAQLDTVAPPPLPALAPPGVAMPAAMPTAAANGAANADADANAASADADADADAAGGAWAEPDASTVQVAEVASLLLALLPYCAAALQLRLLGKIGLLLKSSVLNRSLCCEVQIPRKLLQLLASVEGQLESERLQGAVLKVFRHLATYYSLLTTYCLLLTTSYLLIYY